MVIKYTHGYLQNTLFLLCLLLLSFYCQRCPTLVQEDSGPRGQDSPGVTSALVEKSVRRVLSRFLIKLYLNLEQRLPGLFLWSEPSFPPAVISVRIVDSGHSGRQT